MVTTSQQRVILAAAEAVRKSTDPSRRKCFVSYHGADADEAAKFIETFGAIFIPRVIGVTESDPVVNSENTNYIMDRLREEYLTDSTVTIALIGECTWSRKFVDWEVYSSLRNDSNNRRNGLLAIELSSRRSGALPARINDNVIRDANKKDVGYARWHVYPNSVDVLRTLIEDAFSARTARAGLIVNTRARRIINSSCP